MIVRCLKVRRKATLSRSIITRPNSTSFASSHNTMSDMARFSLTTMDRSRSVRSSAKEAIKMCVSRLSIPFESGREGVAFDLDHAPHGTDQLRVVGWPHGNYFCNRFASFFDNDAFGSKLIEYLQALSFEFARADFLLLCPH